MLTEGYGKELEANTVVYYLRLVGMICRKVGLGFVEQAVSQLIYDHCSRKQDDWKQIA